LKSVFGQLFSQLRLKKYETFRGKKNQQMFNVTFLGEGSIDIGGPYRECVANMSADLMSTNTPLFIPCPNKRNDVGLNREKWVINPSCSTSLHIAMYEFIGVMMGIALRTGETLNLDLPAITWKKLLGIRCDDSDLETIDKLCVQALTEMSKLSKEKFELMTANEKWVTQTSDSKQVELKEGGKLLSVKHEQRDEFTRLITLTRLNEADQQIRAIKKGLNAVVPAYMLSLFSWFDLEMLVCGNPIIDVETLRKHAVYRGISPGSPLIKNFWKAMESFTGEERRMFLRFVWGRSRLPVSESDWSQQFTIHLLKAGDDKLPISHTCFFSLEIPDYSSYDILRSKLLFAAFNCLAIDIDFNPNQSSLNHWIETD